MAKPIQLLLVDVSSLFRNCLSAQLNRRRSLRIVGETGNGAEALSLAHTLQPDVIVVDPAVPDGGPDLVADLCSTASSCAILVLTVDTDGGNASPFLQAGARGYVLKNTENYEISDLVRAIEGVHAGELVVAPEAVDRLLKAPDIEGARGSGNHSLTPRELEVLHLVAQGRTNPEIARTLCLTDHTVKGHLAKILHKLGLDNRVQIATYALEHDLLPSGAQAC